MSTHTVDNLSDIEKEHYNKIAKSINEIKQPYHLRDTRKPWRDLRYDIDGTRFLNSEPSSSKVVDRINKDFKDIKCTNDPNIIKLLRYEGRYGYPLDKTYVCMPCSQSSVLDGTSTNNKL